MLFKRNSSKKLNPKQDAIAERAAERIIRAQFKVAAFLNSRTAHFSKFQKELLLLAISAVFGVISLYLIFSAIN